MFVARKVRRVHLELTSRCNARCPQCPRNLRGGKTNPGLPLAELTLADIMRIFPPAFVRHIDEIDLCGNYGDASVVKDVLESLRYFKQCNDRIKLRFHTNGSARNAAFWSELATLVERCIFAIDGLEDTNALYRRGTVWSNIVRNVRAFTTAGGKASWTFLVFKHNEHQVRAAANVAKSLDVERFTIRKSSRFYADGRLVANVPVHGMGGEFEYELEPPTNPAYLNDAGRALNRDIDRARSVASYSAYLDATPIHCKAMADRQIFVSAEGLVFPCCYTAQIYPPTPTTNADQMVKLIDSLPGGCASINAKLHDIESIIEGPMMERIEQSWERSNLAAGKLGFCAKNCGSYDFVAGQRA